MSGGLFGNVGNGLAVDEKIRTQRPGLPGATLGDRLVIWPMTDRSLANTEEKGQLDVSRDTEQGLNLLFGYVHSEKSSSLDSIKSSTLNRKARKMSSMIETMAERLNRALKERGVTAPELIAATGMSKGGIYLILDGTTTAEKVRASTIEKICKHLRINTAWLRDGRGPMDASRPDDEELVTVRFWDARASAGPGAVNADAELTGGLIFRARSLRKRALNSDNCDTFYVTGDSMSPRLRSDDVIMFDRTDTKIRDGKIYVIQWGDETRVKRLYKELDGSIRVTSDNKTDPENQDRFVNPHDEGFEVLGRFRWLGSWED